MITYAVAVTDRDMWRAVGATLAEMRGRAGFDSSLGFATKVPGAPAKNTIDKIERGDPGTFDTVSDYCMSLGTTLTSVLEGLFDHAEVTPLHPDARWVARMFQEGPDDDARKGMLALAKSQAAQLAASSAASPAAPPVQQASAGGTRRPTRTLRHRR